MVGEDLEHQQIEVMVTFEEEQLKGVYVHSNGLKTHPKSESYHLIWSSLQYLSVPIIFV